VAPSPSQAMDLARPCGEVGVRGMSWSMDGER
jgi:hypothetical protein